MKTRGAALHILMSSLLAREPWDWSYSQVCVCVCVFDLYIYDGPLPVFLLLTCLSDSLGDQQLDEGRHRTHTTHIWNTATVCACVCVCAHACKSVLIFFRCRSTCSSALFKLKEAKLEPRLVWLVVSCKITKTSRTTFLMLIQ